MSFKFIITVVTSCHCFPDTTGRKRIKCEVSQYVNLKTTTGRNVPTIWILCWQLPSRNCKQFKIKRQILRRLNKLLCRLRKKAGIFHRISTRIITRTRWLGCRLVDPGGFKILNAVGMMKTSSHCQSRFEDCVDATEVSSRGNVKTIGEAIRTLRASNPAYKIRMIVTNLRSLTTLTYIV
jgi:hypothetical protein